MVRLHIWKDWQPWLGRVPDQNTQLTSTNTGISMCASDGISTRVMNTSALESTHISTHGSTSTVGNYIIIIYHFFNSKN